MSTAVMEPQQSRRPTREEGLAIARAKKAARAHRTSGIRKAVAVLAVAAFIGPFSVIYVRMATGNDPALATPTSTAASTASRSLAQGTASATASAKREAASSGTGSAGSSSTGSSSTSSSPAPMTTQQS